jgi:hypothetical protein
MAELDPSLLGGVIDEVTSAFSVRARRTSRRSLGDVRRRMSPLRTRRSHIRVAVDAFTARKLREGPKALWTVCRKHDEQAELRERDVDLDRSEEFGRRWQRRPDLS